MSLYDAMSAEVDRCMSAIQADFSRQLYGGPYASDYLEKLPPVSRWARFIWWHWRMRERLANWIYPHTSGDE